MPLSHSQGLNQTPFGIPIPYPESRFPPFGEMRLKRKMETGLTAGAFGNMETSDTWQKQMDSSMVNPKRMCLDQNNESQVFTMTQAESLPGCLKDGMLQASDFTNSLQQSHHHTSQESQAEPTIPANHNLTNMEEDSSRHSPPSSELNTQYSESDLGASMDTDFVPDSQQYNLSPPSTPPHQDHLSSNDQGYCGCVSCKGLRPSPATGRFHCHCYASWRGMYGIDCSFYSDYY